MKENNTQLAHFVSITPCEHVIISASRSKRFDRLVAMKRGQQAQTCRRYVTHVLKDIKPRLRKLQVGFRHAHGHLHYCTYINAANALAGCTHLQQLYTHFSTVPYLGA